MESDRAAPERQGRRKEDLRRSSIFTRKRGEERRLKSCGRGFALQETKQVKVEEGSSEIVAFCVELPRRAPASVIGGRVRFIIFSDFFSPLSIEITTPNVCSPSCLSRFSASLIRLLGLLLDWRFHMKLG